MLVAALTTCTRTLSVRSEGRQRNKCYELETLLNDEALGAQTHGKNHPSFVVEVAQDDGHALTLLAERVRHWHADLVERHERRPCSGGVRSLDRFGGNFVTARYKNDGVPAIGLAADGDPSIVLFGARDDPLITIFVGVRLHAANIASCECLADRQTNVFLPCQDVWNDLGLQLGRTKVEDGWQANYVTGEQAVHKPACAAPPEFVVDDELHRTLAQRTGESEVANSALRGSGQTPLA